MTKKAGVVRIFSPHLLNDVINAACMQLDSIK